MAKKGVTAALAGVSVLLLAACAFAPSAGIALVPAACVLLYASAVTTGAWLLPVYALSFAAAGCFLYGANPFTLTGAAFLLGLTVPVLLRHKLSLWWQAALCAAICVLLVFAVFGIWALCAGESLRDCIIAQFASLEADPVYSFLAERRYARLTAEDLGHVPLTPIDELYGRETAAVYAQAIGRELEGNTLWYVSGFGAFTGGAAYAGGSALAEAAGVSGLPVWRDVRLGKNYVLSVGLPVLLFALLYFYEPMQPVVPAVVNVCITLPTALCGMTLLYHSLCRFTGKAARAIALAAFWLTVAAAVIFFEYGLLIMGFVGLADCLIDVRKLLDWALS